MYEEPKIEILIFLQDDVLKTSSDGWEDWDDDNVDPEGWV